MFSHQLKRLAQRRAAALSLFALTAAISSLLPAQSMVAIVPVLASADLSAWKPWNFSGVTRYTRVELDGRAALKAVSDSTASGVYRKIRIDLEKTPMLHWNWRVDNTLGDIDETSRDGDDFPARVYVMVVDPVFFWKTTALTYVWSSAQPEGAAWPNAYNDNARMIAVRSGKSGLQRWHGEQRDVRADFERFFGKDVRYIDAVAVMTDTDNTRSRAVAYYGDIWFAPR